MTGSMKRVISDAFFSLTMKKNIDKITVKDIVEECGISRQAFYYHFQDIMDVIEWNVDQAFEQTLDLSLKENSLDAALSVFLKPTIERYGMIRKILNSQRREHFIQSFVSLLKRYLSELMRLYRNDLPARFEDFEVAQCFYTYGIVGIVLDFCGRDNIDSQRLSEQIAQLLMGIRLETKPYRN